MKFWVWVCSGVLFSLWWWHVFQAEFSGFSLVVSGVCGAFAGAGLWYALPHFPRRVQRGITLAGWSAFLLVFALFATSPTTSSRFVSELLYYIPFAGGAFLTEVYGK
ncbi:MAG: hypothetical protein V2G48_06615 [bacterium JZ-2024 1]